MPAESRNPRDVILDSISLIESGEIEAARANIEKFVESCEDEARLRLPLEFLGDFYQRLGEFEKAVACYQRILKFSSNEAEIHFKLGMMEVVRPDDMGQRAWNLERAAALGINHPELFYRLGYMLKNLAEGVGQPLKESQYFELQDLELLKAAIANLEKSLELNPDSTQARGNLADIYYNIGQYAESRRHYETIHQENPDLDFVIPRYAHACLGDGDSEQALKLLLPLKQRLVDQGLPSFAELNQRENIQRALELEFRSSVYIYLAEIYSARDDKMAARAELKEFLEFTAAVPEHVALTEQINRWRELAAEQFNN